MLKRLPSIKIKLLLKYCVAAVLIVIPLYPKFPILTIPGTYVAVRAEDFLITILAIIYVFYFLKTNKKQFFSDKLHIALLTFIFIGLVSVVSGAYLTKTVSLSISILHWARRIEYLVPFFVAYAAVRSGTNTKYYLQTVLFVGFLAFLYGFGQEHFTWPVITTQNEEYSKGIALRWVPGARLTSTFAGHYDLSAFLVLVFPLAFSYFFYLKKLFQRSILIFLFIIPMFWLFLQTEARVSFIAYLIGVSFTLWLIKKRKYLIPIILLSIISMLLFSSLGSRYLKTINAYKSKVIGVNQMQIAKAAQAYEDNATFNQTSASPPNEDRSFSIRLHVEWPRAIRAFLKNPLLGTGYSSITLATDNDYLRLLGEIGLVGALSFFLILLRIIEGMKIYLRNIEEKFTLRKAFIAGFLGSYLGLLVNAMFIDVFEASKVAIIFWTLAGIAIALVKRKNAQSI